MKLIEEFGEAPESTELGENERAAFEKIEGARRMIAGLEHELSRVVVGFADPIRQLVTGLLAGGHVLIEGVPGIGKTLLIRSLAHATGLRYARVQCTPDLIPADVIGSHVLDGSADWSSSFRPGPLFTSIVLADEINRATPKTQSAFLEAMEEGQVSTGGETRRLPDPFIVLATQNPIEMEGTFPLPEAQLDRFSLKIALDTPGAEDLFEIARRTTSAKIPACSAVTSADQIRAARSIVRQIPISNELLARVVKVVTSTCPSDPESTEMVGRFVRLGASPRALQSIVLAAKAHALIEGRIHVSSEDVRRVTPAVLRHRLVLSFEAATAEVAADAIIEDVLDRRFA